ncbi:FH2 domain-containing protein [Naegleria gruberi]|uniref:FH2 domain-containing protein n=1 Tax=Naegleria gruberi TaxID=5762 RepID=D2V201_NAEGR|nr:FH2 domain-containing protein [Naegleria gruberi]EFC49400.1 FH2 domain-containing protein [Naegleria gruberi]|eukprot:XP_002682144.1 FH2 domain-containing protein [Naegleria gruberi strain NEG-M]
MEQLLKDKYGDVMVINFTRQFVSNQSGINTSLNTSSSSDLNTSITEITTLASISHFERITHLFEMCKTMYNFITNKTTNQGVIVIVANAQYTCFALLLIASFLSYIEDNEFRSKRNYRTTLEAYYELKKYITEKPIGKVLGSLYTKQQIDLIATFEPSVVRYCKYFNYLTRVPLPEIQLMSLDSIVLSTLDVFKKDANRKQRPQQEDLLNFNDTASGIYFVVKQNNQIVYSTYGTQPESITSLAGVGDRKVEPVGNNHFPIPKQACKLIGDFILFGYQMDELGTIQQLFRYTYNTVFLQTQDNGNILCIEKNRLDWAHTNNEIVDNIKIQLKFSFVKKEIDSSAELKVNTYRTELDSTVKSCPYYLKGNKVAIRLAHITNQSHRRNMKNLISEMEVFTQNKDTMLKKIESKSPNKRIFSEMEQIDQLTNIFSELHVGRTPAKLNKRYQGLLTPDSSSKLRLMSSPRSARRSSSKKNNLTPMREQNLLHFTPPSAKHNPNKENECVLLDMNDPVLTSCLSPIKPYKPSTIPPPPMMGSVPPPPTLSVVPPPPPLQPVNLNVPPPPPMMMGGIPTLKKPLIIKKVEDNNIKKLHWQPIKVVSNNSVWNNSSIDENILDLGEFQKMFSREDATAKTPMKPKSSVPATPTNQGILDMGTNRNVEIILNSLFKTFSNDQITEFINILDTSVLSIQHVDNLKRLVNIANELASKKKELEAKEKLLRTEEFLLSLLSVKNIEAKVNVIGYMHTFESTLDNLTLKIKRKQEAIRIVRTSESFAKVLKYVLTVGNYMNRGKKQLEAANGFHISILPKLGDTKSTNKEMTLMHYLVGVLEKDSIDTLCFEKELESAGVCTFGVSITVDSIDILFKEFKQIQDRIEYLHQVGAKNERELYETRLNTFYSRCAPTLPSVVEAYESLKNSYKECCEYFHFACSKSSKEEEDEFFAYIKDFTTQYKKAKKDIEQKRMAETKLAMQRTSSLSQLSKKRKTAVEQQQQQQQDENILTTPSKSCLNMTVC